MANGSSQSQVSSASSNSRPGGVAPRGTAAATAGMRRCRVSPGAGSGDGGGGSVGSAPESSDMLRFYTDDAPGLKITPIIVLVMSVCFIGFVTALYVFGKIYRKSAVGSA